MPSALFCHITRTHLCRRIAETPAVKNTAELQPVGKTGVKRTPQNLMDAAARNGKDTEYKIEDILQEKFQKGTQQWLVKWVGWPESAATWEPLANLAGCEDFIARFNVEKAKLNEVHAKEVAEKALKKKAEKDKLIAQDAAELMQARENVEIALSSKKSRKRSLIHSAFAECPSHVGYSRCQLAKDGASGEQVPCGELIKYCGGTTPLWNHLMYCHSADYQRLKFGKQDESTEAYSGLPPNGNTVDDSHAASIQDAKKNRLDLRAAYDIVKHKRPICMFEDAAMRDLLLDATDGAYQGPDHHCVRKATLQMSHEGLAYVSTINEGLFSLRPRALKPCLQGDIWGEGDVSLLGLMETWMTEDFHLGELMIDAAPFSSVRHTAIAINAQTKESLITVGFPADDPYTGVHRSTSDSGANIKKGWDGLSQGFCAAHTGELSVNKFLDEPFIRAVVRKLKGMTTHWHQSPAGMKMLHSNQVQSGLPEHKPQSTGNSIRWHFTHDQMDWFRINQTPTQLYDINHDRKSGDVYRQHQMTVDDWDVNKQCIAILQPQANATNLLEGSNYVTASLVLPVMGKVIQSCHPEHTTECPWDGSMLSPANMHDEVRVARTAMHEDYMRRWVNELNRETLRVLCVCTMLDPRFKSWKFPGVYSHLREEAVKHVTSEWKINWAPNAVLVESSDDEEEEPAPAKRSKTHNRERVCPGLGSFLGSDDDSSSDEEPEATVDVTDELVTYLAMPQVKRSIDILVWWREHAARFPFLSVMVRQFLAMPASSAGVERAFSGAGKMHSDLRKSVTEGTLKHSLIAGKNYQPAPLQGRAMAGKKKRARVAKVETIAQPFVDPSPKSSSVNLST